MPRRTTATVHLDALAHNLRRVRALAPTARVWAVVKANAYGHGLGQAAGAFADADGLALLEWDAALALRGGGETRPLLMLEGAFDAAQVGLALAHDLSLVVHHEAQVDWIEHAPIAARDRATRPIDVWLKIDTGMSRLGVPPAQARSLHQRLRACAAVRSVGLMTHFADADRPGGAEPALARFHDATAGLPGDRSLANSAATIDLPSTHRDWIRPGVMLYGASPFDARSAASLGLRPAQTLSAALISTRSLARGDCVGYGATFVAPAPMRIGIVDCGYADGYPRHAPTGTPVAIEGVRSRIVGRVSMDMLAVDLDPVPGAGIGSEVELWGAQVPVDEVAKAAGTIGYELLCAVAPRVRRAWIDRAGG
ncbi:MAG: alanine racemase [Lautropia sp.]